MLTLPTLYQIEKNEEIVDVFSVEIAIEKESEEGKKRFQNKCVSSQNNRMRKEEGATVAASHLPSPNKRCGQSRHLSLGRTGSVLPWSYPNHRENPINYQKCPTNETNVKRRT